jgi:hypothetical protein
MNSEVFCEWKLRFFSVVKPIPEEKVLLLLDGQSSNTLSLDAIEVPHEHGVVMLSLSSHSMH